jgi:hypothetical protein
MNRQFALLTFTGTQNFTAATVKLILAFRVDELRQPSLKQVFSFYSQHPTDRDMASLMMLCLLSER